MAATSKRLAIVGNRDMQHLEELDQQASLHAQLVDGHTRQIRDLIEQRNAILARAQYMEVRTGSNSRSATPWRKS